MMSALTNNGAVEHRQIWRSQTMAQESVVETLDAFAAKNHIDRHKMLRADVENHEAAVFQTASIMVGNQRIEFVFIEYCPVQKVAASSSMGNALQFHVSSDYEVNAIDPDGCLIPLDRAAGDDKCMTILAEKTCPTPACPER